MKFKSGSRRSGLKGRKAPSDRSVSRKTGGKVREVKVASQVEENRMITQTGRQRTTLPMGVGGGRRRTLGGQRPR